MPDYVTRPLGPDTWDAFADLAERNNGVWGGCWCMAFHAEGVGKGRTPEQNRAAKEERVRSDRAHAALVLEDEVAVGWCQFGSPGELPRIKHRRAYEQEDVAAPDWRVTCFFVDRKHRRQGVAAAALAGALDQIGSRGGGLVEAVAEDTTDRKVQASFLFTGTVGLFEDQGFERRRKLGKHSWLVTKVVAGR